MAVACACAGAIACGGGGSSPTSPGNSGGGSASSCRTVPAATRSVQTFVDGQVVSADTSCSLNAATNEVTCNSTFTDSLFGPGTVTQTTRFASRGDIVDEAATNPPLKRSLGTTTITTSQGFSITTTATNGYDAQRRLVSTVLITPTPLGQITNTTTFSAWDSSGRPTTGVLISSPPGTPFPVSITYDNANRTVTQNSGLNTCTMTHDSNGNMIKEVCTGTTGSTTDITINTTSSVCR